jgi:predicted DNA-binding protein (MmcQ/YjbR family)
MNVEQVRAYLLTLPHVVETMQWGDNLVFWVADKAIGGKMFALVNLDGDGKHPVISYAAGQVRFAELVETEGIVPAPYFARIFWVAVERWDTFRDPDWHRELRAAHTIMRAKLPPKTAKILALPAAEQRRIVAERRRQLAAKNAAS